MVCLSRSLSCSLLFWLLLLLFCLLDRTLVAHLVQQVCHLAFLLIGLLQLVQQLGLFDLQLLSNLFSLACLLYLLLDSVVVATLETVHVHRRQGAESRFCPGMTFSDFEELLLSLLQEADVVALNEFIDSYLLRLDIVIGIPIGVKSSLHAILNPLLRLNSILIKLSPIVLLGFFQMLLMLHHEVDSSLLFQIAIFTKLLLLLEVTDPLGGPLLLFTQLDNSVFDLVPLVLHLLVLDDCVHHLVLRFLRGN